MEKSKAEEVSKLKEALQEMEQRVEEVKAMQEQESAKKAVEEALAQEREKISLLTTEIEGLKVCSSIIFCFVFIELHAPTSSTQKLKLMGRGEQFTYIPTFSTDLQTEGFKQGLILFYQMDNLKFIQSIVC